MANYGGILQAWALQEVLKNMGHKPETIDWAYEIPKWKHFYRGLPGAILAKIRGRKIEWPHTPYWIPAHCRGLRIFVKKYINLSSRISFNVIIPYITKHYSTVIVGSDQVWRSAYIPKIETMFLPYEKKTGCKKIAYAASFGTDLWEYTDSQTATCAKLISGFDAVSVRENTALKLCRDKLSYNNCQWVLDPTLLINRSNYETLCRGIPNDEEGYVFAYILDQNAELLNLAQKKADELNLKLRYISVDDKNESTDTIEEWLASFRDAKYVFTDSFHGTVFSLIFNKDFAVYKNPNRGNARFDSLIEMFPFIESRIIKIMALPKSHLDWISFEKDRETLKRYSVEFLRKSLE